MTDQRVAMQSKRRGMKARLYAFELKEKIEGMLKV